MRLTSKLCAQHIGFMFKKHWHVQGKRVARSTGAIEELKAHGIEVKDPEEVIGLKRPFVEFELFKQKPIDTSSYVDCHDFGNDNVLVEGLSQAQIITNSIVVDELPEKISSSIEKTEISSATKQNIHRAILASCVFDAYQEKLPKIKVPGKPMYNLPRIYGIPVNRKCELLISKLLFECEKLAASNISQQNKLVNDAYFEVFLQKNDNLIRLNVKADSLLLSKTTIEPFSGTFEGNVPDIFPMNFTIGLPKIQIPKNELNPFTGIISNYFPHIVFSHFSPEEVTNLYKTPVKTNQLQGRTLLKAFAAAYTKATMMYGNKTKDLEKPLVVQSIHTDGKQFHFGIFQLNTTNLSDSNETKNIWFQTPLFNLYDVCEYQKGQPILDGFNPELFKILNVFYNNS
ncbi:39S ribosomal protein L37, mitochondrial [Condylostylus longicornis]|uniref:39S ribosomal protein L37, mitochondrial n=1 Tax=Condylostylus longicornis TaxID=2530218 RepID=UPI00244DB0FF|nr:39S ribosomal protein L37, mitochondrial [Condylostylus longicornis]